MLKYLHQSYGTHGCDKGYRVFTIEATKDPKTELMREDAVNVLDGSILAKVAPVCKPGHVLKVLTHDEEMGVSAPSGYAYTCIAETEGSFGRNLYAVCHKDTEHVKFIPVDKLGELNLAGDDMPRFNRLVRMKRIGILTLDALGGAGAQTFDIKDGSETTSINRTNIAAAGQIGFVNNAPTGAFTEINCEYISHRVYIVSHNNVAVPANTGRAVVYIVYDNETVVQLPYVNKLANTIHGEQRILPQLDAKLVGIHKVWISGRLGGQNRFALHNGAGVIDNDAMTRAAISDQWAIVYDGGEVF
jgi:hypothetical protein